MAFDMKQVDCADTPIKELQEIIGARSNTIRNDLEAFIRGTNGRVDT